ncbi:MAG: hypothetical protein QXP98_11075 [Thermoproteus sp.]
MFIDKEIKALDEYGNIAPWNRVFPGISVQNVLDQCRIKKIEVYRGSEKILESTDINETIRELSPRGR